MSTFFHPLISYEFGKEWISIKFAKGDVRTCRHSDSGKQNVKRMMRYAKNGKGLASFIMKNKDSFKPDPRKTWWFL